MSNTYLPDVWGSFGQGYDMGRSHRRNRRLGEGFQEGGLEGAERAALEMGDPEAANYVGEMRRRERRFANEETAAAYERMNMIAPRAQNVLRRARVLADGGDLEGARQWLENQRRPFEDWGVSPEQVDQAIASLVSPDANARAQAFENITAAFSQHENPEWDVMQIGGEYRAVAVDPATGDIRQGGSIEGAPRVRPITPEERAMYGIPDNVPAQVDESTGRVGILYSPNAANGGGGYRPISPDEADMWGLPNEGAGYGVGPDNLPRRVTGADGRYPDSSVRASSFAARMFAAEQTLSALEDAGIDPTGVYLARGGMGSEDERRVRQAQREFVNAILRRESGAVISPDEFSSAAQQYFPQPGDSAAVVAQKRAARQRAIQGLINESQGAYQEFYGENSGAAAPPQPRPGSVIGGLTGGMARGAADAQPGATPRPQAIPAEEWNVMTPEERQLAIQLLGGR